MGNSCACSSRQTESDCEEGEELVAPLLHGLLRVHVIQAKDLPDMDNVFFNISRGDLTDPYLELNIGDTCLLKTKVIRNNLAPHWDEKFTVPLCHNANNFVAKVKDREHIGAATVGHFNIPTDLILKGEPVTGWYDLIVGDHGEQQGMVHIWIQFNHVENTSSGKFLYDAYFPPQVNNKVSLYQDADTPMSNIFNGVKNPDGSQYIPPRCWNDIFHSLKNAKRLIYITGWSVYTGISLLRGEERVASEDSNIGELLKKKAAEGVRVCVMTWNETDILDGLMGTHDEDTANYFAGTDVICANVPREKESWLGLGGTFVSTCYTHHQKTIIIDSPGGTDGKLRLTAFVGGLDITDGRFDSPDFPLFKTLHTTHAGDFYSKCIAGATGNVGPRQPWHDIHAKIQGPGAVDVHENFKERWIKQNKSQEAYLVPLDDDFSLEADGPHNDVEGGPWVTQIYRSITSDSAEFSPTRANNLHRKYGKYIDNSIEKAYVNIIRQAEKYIYIENQYFLGSAFSWFRDRSTSSHHIVPRELTQKIVDKIQKGQPFKVYVCIPMFPEGDPVSDASQEILYWQYCTMDSMYRSIAKAIARSKGLNKRPTDYLNFYCLGKRESPEDVPGDLDSPVPNTPSDKLRKSLRHPIYVHSKLMITDDDYIIVGSANINQRSLGGNRDTEICMGAFQPGSTLETGNLGSIHTFRKALWAAHLGGYDAQTDDPSSDLCLNYVRKVTEQYWKEYTQQQPQHSDVHLLPYPIQVDTDGRVKSLASPWDKFPDTDAKVLGGKSGYLPAKLTT